jgi:hypothetical protein
MQKRPHFFAAFFMIYLRDYTETIDMDRNPGTTSMLLALSAGE